MNNSTTHLVLGGARSGKSRLAEQYAQALFKHSDSNSKLIYLATATADDQEMSDRIDQHKFRRDDNWQLVEEPVEIANVLSKLPSNTTILIDCLTLWLSNCMHLKCCPEQRDQLISFLKSSNNNIVMVSNEVGSGIVPLGQLSREFVDESGWLHQEIAKISTQVTLVIAGLATDLKTTDK